MQNRRVVRVEETVETPLNPLTRAAKNFVLAKTTFAASPRLPARAQYDPHC